MDSVLRRSHHVARNALLACLIALVTAAARADEEQDLIATLQSTASVPQKCAACQKLRIIGTGPPVPALAALLGEERTSHAARYALEAMPCAEAGAALREAAGKTSGSIKAGLIDSLGWRRDRQAVPWLAPLLADADLTIASAAASALGRIGGQDADRRAVRRAGQGTTRPCSPLCSKACCDAPNGCRRTGTTRARRPCIAACSPGSSRRSSAPRRGGAWSWPMRVSAAN